MQKQPPHYLLYFLILVGTPTWTATTA